MKQKNHQWVRFSVGLIILLILVGAVYYFQTKTVQPSEKITKAFQTAVPQKATPTPHYEFYSLTIPALRQKTFDGKFTQVQKYGDNDTYTSYLASYTSEGLKINGLLTEPKGDPPADGWPAIVFVHGYIPPHEYNTTGKPYEAYYDFLARQGFVVYKIDLRGHGNSEGQASGAYYSADYVVDTLNAYAALQTAKAVNLPTLIPISPKKIGLWGHSMAGNIVMRSLATKPDIPAAVIWAGAGYSYADLDTYKINDSSYQPAYNSSSQRKLRAQIEKKYGKPGTNNIFWKQMAPINYLSDIKTAIELHHAIDDNVVNIGYTRDLKTLLDKTSIKHEVYEYDSGGHNISGDSFSTAMERTAAFYKENL